MAYILAVHSTWTALSPVPLHTHHLHTGQTALTCVKLSASIVFCFLYFAARCFFSFLCLFFDLCASLIFCTFLSSRILTISSPEKCLNSRAVPLVVFCGCCCSGVFSTSSSNQPLLDDVRLRCIEVSAGLGAGLELCDVLFIMSTRGWVPCSTLPMLCRGHHW